MKDLPRILIIAAIAVLSFMLLTEWVNFQNQEIPEAGTATAQVSAPKPPASSVPTETGDSAQSDLPVAPVSRERAAVPESSGGAKLIDISTDVLDVKIDLEGGDVVRTALLRHYAKINRPDRPFVILENNERQHYVAQSGLIGANGIDTPSSRPLYQAEKTRYNLDEGQQQLTVDLVFAYSDDITITKRFTFERGEYQMGVQYLIDNRGDQAWQGGLFAQLKRDNNEDPSTSGGVGLNPFLGVAYRTLDDPFAKLTFDKMRKEPLDLTMTGGWIAVVQHYFVSAWVPSAEAANHFETKVSAQGNNIARVVSETVTVAPGSQGEIGATLYVGPKDQEALGALSPGLELTVDYGWLWWIAQPLFWLLTQIHGLVGNWGWAIVLVTVLVKILFFQLNATAFRSMANMRRVAPKLTDIKERYGDDRQKQSQAMMELYKKEKINPLGGCLPILVQMPVFIALYWVLMESVELRHAPWLGWIHDLSAMDPYFILPAIMGATMFIQQHLNPPPPDPMQAKIMKMMPIIFTVFFLFFPAGLVLYWVVNNTLSIAQQYIITRAIEKGEAKKA